MNFDQAFEALIGHEGGYIDDRRDPGGETKYGISKRSYPQLNIAALTLEQAKRIYLRDFWGPCGAEALPDAMRLQVFDMAVNSGVKQTIKTLQRAVGETEDGYLGPRTLQSINSIPVARLVARFNGYRLLLMADLSNWPTYGRGWSRRIAANLLQA